jgi:hypothetical protein
MEATHDIDFVLWCLAPRKPMRVYAQEVHRIMKGQYNVPDCVWIVVTMDDGTAFTIGAGWVLPPAYPNFSTTWIEFVGTEGAVMVDDTHRDFVLLPGTGDRSRVGRPHGCRRRVQRNRHRDHEHGWRAGRFFNADRLWRSVSEGILDRAILCLRSAALASRAHLDLPDASQLHNAHLFEQPEIVTVYYRWHPLYRQSLRVHRRQKSPWGEQVCGAIVYIRQSTPGQVLHHKEGQLRQYALEAQARQLGFQSVAVIDSDLGCSGSGLVERNGFQQLVGAVCAGAVGAIFCLEASRLARNGREWHHLIELCG